MGTPMHNAMNCAECLLQTRPVYFVADTTSVLCCRHDQATVEVTVEVTVEITVEVRVRGCFFAVVEGYSRE